MSQSAAPNEESAGAELLRLNALFALTVLDHHRDGGDCVAAHGRRGAFGVAGDLCERQKAARSGLWRMTPLCDPDAIERE